MSPAFTMVLFTIPKPRFLTTGVLAVLGIFAQAAAPILTVPAPSILPRSVPVGKTLALPLTAEDSDGDALSYTVRIVSGKLFARIRTGNPSYKITVHTDDDGSNPPAQVPIDGEMEFQLFRHAARQTTDLIGGLAQSGYYDNVLMHRVIPGFVLQGGDKAGTGSGASPFTIPHELRPELIYTGRGQLAMANSQGGYSQSFPFNGNSRYSTGSFRPTNGTQFFITLGQPRHLDFRHTLFGQLMRGFDIMDRCADVATNSANDRPTTNLLMTAHSLFASKTDAVLLISATRPGPGEIIVTAEDPSGATSSVNIPLNIVNDTVNDPPIILPMRPTVARPGIAPQINVRAFDLESDAITTRFPVRDNFLNQTIFAGLNDQNLIITGRPNIGAWDLTIGVGAINDPLIDSSPIDAMRFELLEIGVGDKAILGTAQTLQATAGVATGSTAIGTFRHGAIGTGSADFVATVNWGDGSAIQTSTGTTPPIQIIRSALRPGIFEVRGNHTYARPGNYPLIVTVDGPNGATGILNGQAIVYSPLATIRPLGRDLAQVGDLIAGNRAIATFADSTPGTRATDYSAIIDWGDGTRKSGKVRQKRAGEFAVYGTHRYLDAESYSVAVHITREPSPEAAVAWSSISLRGFEGPKYLPPFVKANITSIWNESPSKIYRGNATDLVGSLFLVNGGEKGTGRWNLRFWLSDDENLETGIDRVVRFGPLNNLQTQLRLNSLAPGAGGTLPLRAAGGADLTLRLPAGETGTGKFIIAQLDYSDPITDQMPVPKAIPFGPLDGILVSTNALTIREGLTDNSRRTATFTVRLDTAPTGNVTIPLDIVNNLNVPDTTRATLDKTQLIFTPANATAAQTVTVTAGDDLIRNNSTANTIRIRAASSTDLRFNGMDAADIALTIQDNIPGITVTPSTLTIKEGDTNEPMRSATFTIRLGATPTAPVTIPLVLVNSGGSTDTTRATLDVPQLVISDDQNHTVTVTVVDDALTNGSGTFTIRTNAAASTDTRFSGQNPGDVTLTVQDNEPAP